jgi:hypothetical protein
MKNKFRLFGLIALVAVIGLAGAFLTSCGEKGGTFEITNNVSADLGIFGDATPDVIITVKGPLTLKTKTISSGKNWKCTVEQDGEYTITGLVGVVPVYEQKFSISGGETKKVSVTKTK